MMGRLGGGKREGVVRREEECQRQEMLGKEERRNDD